MNIENYFNEHDNRKNKLQKLQISYEMVKNNIQAVPMRIQPNEIISNHFPRYEGMQQMEEGENDQLIMMKRSFVVVINSTQEVFDYIFSQHSIKTN